MNGQKFALRGSRITFFLTVACLFLSCVSIRPSSAQSRWGQTDDRSRTGLADAATMSWLGGGWLGDSTEARKEWRLGASGSNTEVGVVIRDIARGSAAEKARIEVGDIIVSVAGFQVGLVGDGLYELADEITRRADSQGSVSMVIQDHRSFGLAAIRVQLDNSRQSLKGSLIYRERTPLPSDAVVTVQIDNVTRPNWQVGRGTSSFRPSAGSEIPFEIAYDPTYINPQDTYQVRAVVTSGGRTIMSTPQPQRVITAGNPSQVSMQLTSVSALAVVPNSTGGVVSAGYPNYNYNELDDKLIAIYRKYLRRAPTTLELAALRATPGIASRLDTLPFDVMAGQEYYDAAGNNNTDWLRKVFGEIVQKQPSQQELDQWMIRFAELRNSRTDLLKQLSIAAGRR